MTISTKFATLALGAASMIALMISPASAQTAGGSKCEQLRSMDKTKQCLSVRPEDTVKTSTWSSRQTDHDGTVHEYKRYSDGSGHVIDRSPNGDVVYTVRNRTGQVKTYEFRNGGGGSGGRRSTN